MKLKIVLLLNSFNLFECFFPVKTNIRFHSSKFEIFNNLILDLIVRNIQYLGNIAKYLFYFYTNSRKVWNEMALFW